MFIVVRVLCIDFTVCHLQICYFPIGRLSDVHRLWPEISDTASLPSEAKIHLIGRLRVFHTERSKMADFCSR